MTGTDTGTPPPQAEPPPRPADQPLLMAFLAVYGCCWLFYTALTLLLHAACHSSPFHSGMAPAVVLNLVSGEFVLNAAALLPVAVLATAASRAGRLLRLPLGALVHLLCAGFLLLSWGQALKTTVFAGAGSIQMLFTNPLALAQHALHFHPAVTAAFPFALLAIAAAGALLTTQAAPRLRRLHVVVLMCIAAAGTGFCRYHSIPWDMVPFQVTGEYNNPETGRISTLKDYLNELYTRQTGPLTTLVAERMLARTENLAADPAIRVQRRPIVTMDQYARGVDAGALHRCNVILILVESLRNDELMAYGNSLDVMPNVNRLAAESSVFLDNYSTSSHSNYADLAALSSHYPLRSRNTHVYPRHPPYPRVLIYDVLRHFGYHTAVISSQNEAWGNMINYLNTGGLEDLLHSGNFEGGTYDIADNDVGAAAMNKRSGKVDDALTVDRITGWIDAHRDAPFFIYTNLQNSHFPFPLGPGFKRRFGPDEIDFEPRFNVLRPREIAPMRARYRDSLAYIDQQIGRLFDHLRKAGLWDNTIVIISGDTGQAFMEHGFSAHANRLYNEVLRTPLIIRVPGRPPAVSRRLAMHLDIPPTVLGAIGLPKHPSFQGVDLFKEPEDPGRDAFLVAQSPLAQQYAIVKDGWKLMYEPFTDCTVLYNLANDPGERTSVAERQPALARCLRSRLDTWRKLQVDYYQNESEHMTTYPPVMDSAPPCPATERPAQP